LTADRTRVVIKLFLGIVREAILLNWQKNNIRLFIRSVLNS
jgi:hypothetical protein